MGNNNSTQNEPTRDEIVDNLKRMFPASDGYTVEFETVQSLDMDHVGGECTSCSRNRYTQFEKQLGGDVVNLERANIGKTITTLFPPKKVAVTEKTDALDGMTDSIIGGSCDMTSSAFIDDIARVGDLSATSFEHSFAQLGAANISDDKQRTSSAHMSEIGKINVESPTSIVDYTEKPLGAGCGECGGDNEIAEKQVLRKKDANILTSILSSLSDIASQSGGCAACGAGRESQKPAMPDRTSSDEMNVMPFYSSTSGTEYYNNMQRMNRFT